MAQVTKENDEVHIGGNGEHDNEIAETTNENEDTNVAEMVTSSTSILIIYIYT